jgi:hypothetical protein
MFLVFLQFWHTLATIQIQQQPDLWCNGMEVGATTPWGM